MQCLQSQDTAGTLVFHPPAPEEKLKLKICIAKQHWSEVLGVPWPTLPLQRKRQNSEGTGGSEGIQGRKGQTTGELVSSWSCECLWFLHNHAPRQFRTSISELVCKHWVLPEAAEAGRFTFLFSQREHSGRGRCSVESGRSDGDSAEIQFKFRGSKDTRFGNT